MQIRAIKQSVRKVSILRRDTPQFCCYEIDSSEISKVKACALEIRFVTISVSKERVSQVHVLKPSFRQIDASKIPT